MTPNPHFAAVGSWEEAAELMGFAPRAPRYTAGRALSSLAVFVMDHRGREVSRAERTLEAHYGSFGLSQSEPGQDEARRRALETRYGPSWTSVTIARREGRSYPLGPEREPGDIDGRAPAVVTWADGARFYFLASGELDADVLLRIAESLYDARRG